MAETNFFQNPAVTHFLSFVIGVFGSFFVWWLLNHTWIPRIRFGEEICRYSVGEDKALYVCAFENSGRRNIIDAEVVTRIGVKNFNEAESWIHFSIETNSSQIPVIGPGRRALVRVFDERQSPTYIDEPPPLLRNKLDTCKYLEDVFRLSAEVQVQLHVFGYDSFSGARHHYASPSYTRHDVRSGRLNGLVVVAA